VTVLVDTTVWSLALRRRPRRLSEVESAAVDSWRGLVEEGRAALMGPIRQEILSGIRDGEAFESLREILSAFRCLEVLPIDYDQAAWNFNQCRSAGVAAGHVDMLICATASRHEVPIFSTDRDFGRYERHIPITLHSQR